MTTFQISQPDSARSPYLEFARTPHLSFGVYRLAAGAPDWQRPHTEDEVYYVVDGRATIRLGAEEIPVEAGSIVLVRANMPHRFHSIVEDLILFFVLGPAEGTAIKLERTAEP